MAAAAMRLLSRRVVQNAAPTNHMRTQTPFFETSYQSLPLSNAIFERYGRLTRGIQTQSDACIQGEKVAGNAEVSSVGLVQSSSDAENAARSSVMSKLKVSSRHDLAIVFTCTVCETRSVKTCCREAYEKGVVVVRCGGCDNQHLIADRLGWFGEPGSIEDLLAARGDVVKKGPIDSFNLTLDDLAGSKL